MPSRDTEIDIFVVAVSLVGLMASLVSVIKFGLHDQIFNLVFAIISLLSFCAIVGVELSKKLGKHRS